MRLHAFIGLLGVLGFLAIPRLSAIPVGPAVYIFNDFPGVVWSVPVWTYRPADAGPEAPIVFVCHGLDRNGRTYRNAWQAHAERLGFILVAPEFTTESFPGSRSYNQGNLFDSQGRSNLQTQWSFQVIERVFDDIVSKSGSTRATYHLYGHSAGAQFVHRMLLLMPGARIERAVSANAGWYTVPDTTVDYPYGLRGSPFTTQLVNERLRQNHLVLLGTEDNDPNDPNLNRSVLADLQGTHRFARGHYFFDTAQAFAVAGSFDLGLSLAYAPGVGHSNAAMAAHAANWLIYPSQVVGATLYTESAGDYAQDFRRGLPSPALTNAPWGDNNTFPGVYFSFAALGTPAIYHIGQTSANGRLQHWRANNTTTRGFLGGRPNFLTGDLYYGIRLTNNTGRVLNRISLSYVGRQFHNSNSGVQGRILVALQTGSPPSLADGEWMNVPALTFYGPHIGNGSGAGMETDPISPSSQAFLPPTAIAGIRWQHGEDLWIRWMQPVQTTSEHGLGIGDIRFAAEFVEAPDNGSLPTLSLGVPATGEHWVIALQNGATGQTNLLQFSNDLAGWSNLTDVLPIIENDGLSWHIEPRDPPAFFRVIITSSTE